MNYRRLTLLLTFATALCFALTGCLTHPGYNIRIVAPHDLSIVEMPPPGDFISVSINTTSDTHIYVTDQLQLTVTLYDNGRLAMTFTDPRWTGVSGYHIAYGGDGAYWFPTTLGEHLLSVTIHVADSSANLNFDMTATARVCVVSSLSHPTAADTCLTNTLYDIIYGVYPDTAQQSSPLSVPTPASAADCPSGTYFADVTHQCIAIATPTTGNGGGGVVCSNITSSSICDSTPGCTFNSSLKKCMKK